MTRDVYFTGGVSAIGEIQVFHADGTTVFTSFDFGNFTGGVEQETWIPFYINNTGNQPVYVYWNISTSSIAWYKNGSGYRHDEAATYKHNFTIWETGGYWAPDTEARMIPVGQRTDLHNFMLTYTGEPRTSGTFSLTVTFYVRDA